MLIANQVDVNAQSNLGSSALQLLTSFETSSRLHQREAKMCVKALINCGAYIHTTNLNNFVSPLLSSCRINMDIFEILVQNLKICNMEEVFQVLEFCFVSPDNFDSWTIIQILKKYNVIQIPSSSDTPMQLETKPTIDLSSESVANICERTQVDPEIVKFMLGIGEIKSLNIIDKYFVYGIRFGSSFEIDVTRTDKHRRNYLTQLILLLCRSNKSKKKIGRAHV